jgi:hypothetical protein
MNPIFFVFVLMALTACDKGTPSIAIPRDGHIYSVNEFVSQPALRKRFLMSCSDDPGQTERDPNCINVISAERIASAGTTIPRITP